MKKLFILVFITLTILFVGCCSLDNILCPYIISDLRIEQDEKSTLYDLSGIYLTVYNNTEKTINEVTLSMYIYDEDGNPVGTTSNHIVSKYEGIIDSHCKKEIVISADEYVGSNSNSTNKLDFVYISQIVFIDGSVWTDEYGLFAD